MSVKKFKARFQSADASFEYGYFLLF